MKSVVVEPEAEMEIIEATAWHEERQEGLGLRFANDVDKSLDRLPVRKLKPDRELGALGVMVCEVGRPWPYRFAILEETETLHVVAFAHHRREPGYFRSRLTR